MATPAPPLSSTDLLRIRFWLTQTVLLIALGGILSEGISQSPLLIALIVFLGLSLAFPRITGLLSRRWMPALSVVLIGGIVIDVALHWPAILDPMLRAGLLILWTRTLFYRTARESMQLLFLALFLIMLNGVLSISISYAVQLIAFSPLAMILLMLNSMRNPADPECLTHADWRSFQATRFLRQLRHAIHPHLFALIALCAVFMLLSISLIFLVLPRFHLRQWLPSLSVPGVALSGFSEQFSLGAVRQIVLDPSVAFRVEIPNPDSLPANPYWRMLVLDVYENGQFFKSDKTAQRLRSTELFESDHFLSNRMIEDPQSFSGENWDVFLEGSVSRFLPIPGSFRAIQFQSVQLLTIDPVFSTFSLRQPSSQLTTFRLRHVDADTPFRASALDALLTDPEWRAIQLQSNDAQSLTEYPQSTLSARLSTADANYLAEVVEQLRSVPNDGSLNDPTRAYVNHVIRYLHDRHSYSLRATPGRSSASSRDPMIAWMQSGSSGHCEYFAAAAVLLCRANGIPARMVTGFAGGEWNRDRTLFTVRNLHAHAWCEVFDLSGQWLRVDPTPPGWQAAHNLEDEGSFARGFAFWQDWIESLKLQYYRHVVGFDGQSQFDLAHQLAQQWRKLSDPLQRLSRTWGRWFPNQSPSEQTGFDSEQPSRELPQLLPLLGFAILTVLFVLLLFTLLPARLRQPLNREQHIRQHAGKLLQRYQLLPTSNPQLTLHLQTLRFGPTPSWPDPKTTFHQTRREIRRNRR
ncbi:MAG: DUF3488 and transglutaminase-like domain-containing protein [Puniceicoccaceae bacterium]